MNAKFIIEQIVMSMSFLKADQFTEHTFVKQEDEHGMYKFLKTVINHPETGYLQNGIKSIATKFEDIKKNWEERSWSMVLDILAELNKVEDIEELREVLLNLHFYLTEKNKLPRVDIFLTKPKWEPQIEVYNYLVSDHFNSGCLTEDKFDNWIELALSTYCRQYQLIFDYIKLPEICSEHVFQIANSEERRDYIISSLRSFLFDKETTSPEPKGDSVSDDTQAVQEILNKPIKDKEMKQEQFYAKLYFYSDAKRIVFSGGKIEDIAECFSKLSVVDQADVCNQFGIAITSIKHVPGIATVLATMFMNMDMQILKRKLSELVSHSYIGELHGRIEQCETWEDANKLHQYVMSTFNGMQVESVKDIIVKHFGLENHDQFQHDGTQLAGFFAGVIFADAMSMVHRKEEYRHQASQEHACDGDCPGCSEQREILNIAKQPMLSLSAVIDAINNADLDTSKDNGETFVPDIYSRNFGIGMIKGKQEPKQPVNIQHPVIIIRC